MSSIRIATRSLRSAGKSFRAPTRTFASTTSRGKDEPQRIHSTAPEHREYKKSRSLNPAVPNTTSTNTNDFPKVGKVKAPPDLLSSVDPNYKPSDPNPGKIEHVTGGTQESGAQKPELGVGEIEGITFKVEPLRREGEDHSTKRARLLCR